MAQMRTAEFVSVSLLPICVLMAGFSILSVNFVRTIIRPKLMSLKKEIFEARCYRCNRLWSVCKCVSRLNVNKYLYLSQQYTKNSFTLIGGFLWFLIILNKQMLLTIEIRNNPIFKKMPNARSFGHS